jgi:transposase
MITGHSSQIRVYVAVGSMDLRKSIDGLAAVVSQQFVLDPFTGHLFAFCNRRRNCVKVLYWDRNGFCVWQKRLEKERFRWPKCREEVLSVSSREFGWLLDGLEIQQAKAHQTLRYAAVC